VLEDNGFTRVYIDGKRFIQCMRLVLSIPLGQEPTGASSIDEAKEKYGTILEGRGQEPPVQHINIDPVTEFQGHCSNLQAWVENDYDPRLIHSNIAFPLLKALAKVGDAKAKRVLDSELSERISNGSPGSRRALLESCSELIDTDVFNRLLDELPVPDRARIWQNRAYNLYFDGNIKASIHAYRMGLSIDPMNEAAWSNLGLSCFRDGDMAGAVEAYRSVVKINPGNQTAWHSLGHALAKVGKIKDSVEAYNKSIPIYYYNAEVYDNFSRVLDDLHDREQFMEAYLDVLYRDPENEGIFYGNGLLRSSAGDFAGAIRYFNNALVMNPRNVDAWLHLGDVLIKIGDPAGASSCFRKALDMRPDDADTWNKLSCEVIEGGFFPYGFKDSDKEPVIMEAIHAARQAIELAPEVGFYHTTLGEAFEASGNIEGAIKEYYKALDLDPTEDFALEYLKRLNMLSRLIDEG
jgi:tetratricopeptide (TPR) repeat protein